MKAPAAPHDPHRVMERRGAGFELNYTRDTGRWQDRKWEFIPATLTELWHVIDQFVLATRESGALAARRERQAVEWMHAMIEEELHHRFFRNPRIQHLLPGLEQQVASSQIPAATAAQRLLSDA